MEDCSDPFADRSLVRLGHVMWQRKKNNFRSAQALGLACDLVITPNHVYADQCRPELAGDQGRPHVRPIDLSFQARGAGPDPRNYENLFADLARSGVRLTSISACPYDFGGCACDQCKPWIVTFAKLMHEIHAVAAAISSRRRNAHDRLVVERRGTSAVCRLGRSPGARLDRSRVSAHPLRRDGSGRCPSAQEAASRGAFVHIGYADTNKPEDIYGLYGSGDRAGANSADHPVVVGPWRDRRSWPTRKACSTT